MSTDQAIQVKILERMVAENALEFARVSAELVTTKNALSQCYIHYLNTKTELGTVCAAFSLAVTKGNIDAAINLLSMINNDEITTVEEAQSRLAETCDETTRNNVLGYLDETIKEGELACDEFNRTINDNGPTGQPSPPQEAPELARGETAIQDRPVS